MVKKEKNEQPKIFEDQFDDENVLYVFRRHPIVMRKGLVFGMLGPLLGVIPAAVNPNLGLNVFFGGLAGGLALGALIFSISWIPWYFSVFIVTDQRFIQIMQKGIFHRGVTDINLSQVQMVNYEIAGIEQTLLGFGTILVQTYVGDLTIHDVHHPAKTARKIQMILRDLGLNTAPPMQVSGSAPRHNEEA
jgi:uncharacterized membrane protein YdbT with pleckstrin-like domain